MQIAVAWLRITIRNCNALAEVRSSSQMKMLTNGNPLIVGNQPFPAAYPRHDQWPIHATEFIEYGLTSNSLGQFAFIFSFKLVDAHEYIYATTLTGTHDSEIVWYQIFDSWFLPDGDGPFEGEAFNYLIRSHLKFKLTVAQFHQWQLGNL